MPTTQSTPLRTSRATGTVSAAPVAVGDEALEFLRLVWALDHGLQVRSKRMERDIGLTGPQRLVVRLVARFPTISAGELASLLHVHKSTLTGVLQRLEERGLLLRKADAQDGRRVRLSLSARGLKASRPTAGTVEASVRAVIGRADASDLEGARRVLADLADALMGVSGDGGEPGRGSARHDAGSPSHRRRPAR
jgi:DNA-binding MarR family transcriptional regulator